MAADIMTTPRTVMTVMIITRSESPSTAPVKKHYKDLYNKYYQISDTDIFD